MLIFIIIFQINRVFAASNTEYTNKDPTKPGKI